MSYNHRQREVKNLICKPPTITQVAAQFREADNIIQNICRLFFSGASLASRLGTDGATVADIFATAVSRYAKAPAAHCCSGGSGASSEVRRNQLFIVA
jgi:hypothetical protein